MIESKFIRLDFGLLNGDEFQFMSEQFQIQSIPRYMIVDKNGRIHDKDAMPLAQLSSKTGL
ncbi:hypothetical protein MM236_01345 [Belliella sp. DSM 107340]|uniref:Uncharacterized protein n=1 Tax=Belliella calami TaxID=2923436 RepID=A0ABS9UJ09_9BACT|nr:hypothetical protein [Belliella calami]MCH7396605.1 hypothetical protein [Belliella calami]